MVTEMLDGQEVPVIEVIKSPSGTPITSGSTPASAEGAMISNVNQEGFVQADDAAATREVVSPGTLPLTYEYDEKQMMANVSTAISADIQDMTETELLADETFGYASKKMFRAFRGEDFTGTDEEATQFGIDLMRRVENNLVELGDFSHQVQDMSEDDAKVALYMMDMFEAKEFTGRGFSEALGYMGLDPTTYIGLSTFGFGFAGKEAAKQATKQGVKAALQKIAYSGATVGAVEGGVYTGAFEHGKQVVSEAAGEGYDTGSLGLNVAIGAGAGAAAGKYLPEIFDYAGEKVSKWATAKNFKAEVRAAADAGDEDAIQVLADLELLDNHFDSDGFMRRKLDEFEQTRVGQAVTGIQRIVPEDRKSVDEIIIDAAGLNAKQRKQKLSAAMRDASPEDKQKLITEMKASATPPKPKSAKAQKVILEKEEFNASFYSKLEHEVNKIPDDMVFENGQELVDYMRKQGVKQDEIDGTGFDIAEGGLITGQDVKSSLPNRKDTISKRTYDDASEGQALDREDWESDWVTVDEQSQNIDAGDAGWGTRITDDRTGAEGEVGIVYNDEVYVDDSGYQYDYEEMQEDWFDNYYGGDYDSKARELADNDGSVWEEISDNEQRDYVIAAASDDSPWYDSYYAKEEFITSRGQTFDTMDEAVEDVLDDMHEDYTQYAGEDGAETYSEYTVDGGDDYKLEVYQMEEFGAPAGKETAQEPHFGSLEFGADNVQVHARMKTRTDADGNTGTVLEEVQSQWEQDWRKAGGGQKAPTEEQIQAANKKIDELSEKARPLKLKRQKLRDEETILQERKSEVFREYRGVNRLDVSDPRYDEVQGEYLDLSTKGSELRDEIRTLDSEINSLNDEASVPAKIVRWKEPTIATPPIKNRTQYTKLAMLDNLINSLENGENFFGWINGHIQNGGTIETTQGMSQAYDIEMPRIIQKATGETPYMVSFEDGRAIGQKDIYDEAKVYWDSKNAQDLEYYDNIAKEETDEKWYWKIDYTDALKKKLKDAKIQMYGVGGAALVGANGESLEGEENAN